MSRYPNETHKSFKKTGRPCLVSERSTKSVKIIEQRNSSSKITVFLLSNIYTVWILVSIWNCAYNVKDKIWGDISRVIVVLNVILIFLIYTGILSVDYQSIIQKNP